MNLRNLLTGFSNIRFILKCSFFSIDVENKFIRFGILFGPLVSHGPCNFEGKVLVTSLMGKATLILDTGKKRRIIMQKSLLI